MLFAIWIFLQLYYLWHSLPLVYPITSPSLNSLSQLMGDIWEHPSVVQAKEIVITGGDFSQTVYHVHHQMQHDFEEEKRKLHEFVSHHAFHDSYKHAYSKHHVLTPADEDIINTATNWASNKHTDRGDKVLHLDLSGCTSGQYVAQHIAELLEQRNCLRGTFFFRFPEHARHPERFFVTTLAYQLGISLPDANLPILAAIRSDPYMFTRSTRTQVQRLLVEPLRQTDSSGMINIFIITFIPGLLDATTLSSVTHAIDAAVHGHIA
ncbi:hypothetical protein D9619_009416 [Psilocybe cf. subviscida]|uniref:Uncharacterized protein n=1 Tax=Psilocybe cf. subviscida TaxID=2480587 RepID=A0A8H5BUJ7_9AGAR|nr:hypothetical protein D9619_009416 [Psilocybe cf. subviscida]